MICLLMVLRPVCKLKTRKTSASSVNQSQNTMILMGKDFHNFQRNWAMNHLQLKLKRRINKKLGRRINKRRKLRKIGSGRKSLSIISTKILTKFSKKFMRTYLLKVYSVKVTSLSPEINLQKQLQRILKIHLQLNGFLKLIPLAKIFTKANQ